MSPRLQAELERLYAPAARSPHPEDPNASGAIGGGMRALGLGLVRNPAWATLAPLWRGVQQEWGWPAPAIAVGGERGLQLWFSLAAPLPAADAEALLLHLQRHWLPDVADDRFWRWPAAAFSPADGLPPVLPPRALGPEQWSAFVAPDLAAVFGDTPWLDLPPGDEAQADLLARLRSVPAADVERFWASKNAPAALPQQDAAGGPAKPTPHGAEGTHPAPAGAQGGAATTADAQGLPLSPRAFLTAVMNDPEVALALRIEAAKALL